MIFQSLNSMGKQSIVVNEDITILLTLHVLKIVCYSIFIQG